MFRTVTSISSLLLAVAILLSGTGLYGTLLAIRGSREGIADLILGLIMSAYFVGFLLGTYGCPRIIQRIGHIRAFALFATVASCTPILHAMFVTPWAWAGLRIVTGTCLVGLYMIVESWLNAQAPNEHRGQVFAAYMVVNFLALAIGQNLLLLYSPMGFELFGLVAVLISLALAPVAMTRIEQPTPVHAPRLKLADLFRTTPAGMAGALGSGLAMGAFWGMGPVLAQRLGLGAVGVAGFMTAAILGGAALQWPIGRWSDRHDRRFVLAAVTAGGALSALLAGFVAPHSLPLLFACMFLFGGLGFTIYSISVAHANDRLAADQLLQGASSMLLVHGVGAAIGPTLAGLWIHGLGPIGLMVHFAVVLVATSLYVRLQLPPRDEAEPHPATFVPMVRTTPAALEMIAPEAGDLPDEAPPETAAAAAAAPTRGSATS
ncbi:MAG: MFS transporter [Nevskiales bacterium]|nr:MFS transporter [Nevskiales bacterium]